MGCVPCAAKAAARNQQYEWSGLNAKGETVSVVYPTEAAAKTKVRKVGGTYKPYVAPVT